MDTVNVQMVSYFWWSLTCVSRSNWSFSHDNEYNLCLIGLLPVIVDTSLLPFISDNAHNKRVIALLPVMVDTAMPDFLLMSLQMGLGR